jgi:hypothetical protein
LFLKNLVFPIIKMAHTWGWTWWPIPGNPVTWEEEVGDGSSRSSWAKVSSTLSEKNKTKSKPKAKGLGA